MDELKTYDDVNVVTRTTTDPQGNPILEVVEIYGKGDTGNRVRATRQLTGDMREDIQVFALKGNTYEPIIRACNLPESQDFHSIIVGHSYANGNDFIKIIDACIHQLFTRVVTIV